MMRPAEMNRETARMTADDSQPKRRSTLSGDEAWRFRQPGAAERGVDLAPGTTYEVLTRQMVDRLTDDLAEIKSRLDGLLYMLAGAIVLDLVIRLTTLP